MKFVPSKNAYDGTPRAHSVLINTENDPVYKDLLAEASKLIGVM